MSFCNKCGKPFRFNSQGSLTDYTGDYCVCPSNLTEIFSYPTKIVNGDLEILKAGYRNKQINEHQIRAALDRAEITLCEYLKIINQ